MTNTNFDLVIISHIPSFYKVNLYNKIAEFNSVYVIFISNNSIDRNNDFVSASCHFEYIYLNKNDKFELRNKSLSCLKLIPILLKLRYRMLLLGSWDLPEFWLASFLSPRINNAMVQESTVFESKVNGIKGFLKRLFVRRINFAFVSGLPHLRLMKSVNFSRNIYITGGVGLPARPKLNPFLNKSFSGKFLYVGRFSDEKNIQFLLNIFKDNVAMKNYTLTVVGDGFSSEVMERFSAPNINFIPYLPHSKISTLYLEYDVLILPSLSEVWGLVVEESLYCNTPVIASNMVGCSEDLISNYNSGVIFNATSEESLLNAIHKISLNYSSYVSSAAKIDFQIRDLNQVAIYSKVLHDANHK